MDQKNKFLKVSKSENKVADLISEMMNASVSFHKLHLKVSGLSSYASHKALGKLYEEMKDFADGLAEQYQGSSQKILQIPDLEFIKLNTVGEAIKYCFVLKEKITYLQNEITESEIINFLDNIKSSLNIASYKLTFLK